MILEDQHIIELISKKKTKEKGFNMLLDKYEKRLYWGIRKIVISHDDASDVLQNTCIKIWKGLEDFQAQSSIYTWIYKISINEALLHIRKNHTHNSISKEDTQLKLLEKLESDVYFDGNEIERKLQQAIIKLPEKQRLVFNMKYYDKLKYEAISEMLNVSVGGLKASYHLAVKKIKTFLDTN